MAGKTKEEETYFIKLPRIPGPNAPTFEMYGINGKNIQVERGKRIAVPKALYDLICDNEGAEEAADLFSIGLQENQR